MMCPDGFDTFWALQAPKYGELSGRFHSLSGAPGAEEENDPFCPTNLSQAAESLISSPKRSMIARGSPIAPVCPAYMPFTHVEYAT